MLNTKITPWPSFSEDEIEAVGDILRSGRINQWTGEHVKAFEKEFAEFIGTDYAIAVSNGTVALDLLFQHFDITGQEVIVTSRTFLASASSVVMAGGIPIFVDVDEHGNIDPELIQQAITDRTVAILCVHLGGRPCDMDVLEQIASDNCLLLFEDCAQAHGGVYNGRKLGSFGNAAAWSFCQDKIMSTAGEGGMITTNDKWLYRSVWSFKDHGKSFNKIHGLEAPKIDNSGFRWVHENIGSNYRMTEIQAVVGRMQLQKLPQWVLLRNMNAQFYDTVLGEFPCIRLEKPLGEESIHARYKYYAYVIPEKLAPGWSRDVILKELNDIGVPVYPGSCSEVYLEEALYQYRPQNRLPMAKMLGETSLMFLVHPTIAPWDKEFMAEGLRQVLSRACGMKNENSRC